ncbi:NAD(P)/FAD-dependent oxidoreductase [Ruixingdingia sedimenti]|uniref:FAD/NAD(P)-binding oxidoreductase n=1 Tax=Ruixingdingia sedimenti TaxID=3073604 RepID=A0ABU1FA77_9RHOB|nr:FAD/NAD(P)-binding oxidoreductase [Xinfangfangia sp. LG-4]MDR5653791.1 FAD/NAD(P)-binding oxidoreductase [Xinfangfangia sp. LG-4]
MKPLSSPSASRRAFLGLAAGGIAALSVPAPGRAAPLRTQARIVILGAGAGGAALANRLAERLDGAQVTLVDPRREHWYQPGFTLIAAGLKPASYSVSDTGRWLPKSATWVAEAAAEIDPFAKVVTTTGGQKLPYDFLIVATGLKLDWDAVEGFSLDMVGRDGISAHYAGPDYAAKTWAALDAFTDTGGQALIGRPATEMKCAGAPLKLAFLAEDHATRKGNRGKVKITYAAQNKTLFGVPIVSEKVRMLFAERGIDAAYDHVLKAIDPGRRIATYATPDGDKELGYDFINVIPPMRAPDAVRNSPLPWADKWTDQGWVEADQKTLRHPRFPEIFALGDVAGVPKGKTAASVKWQVPVIEDHLVAQIAGAEGTAIYDGYTSCPLITRIGRAMLVEFDYHNNLVPSFPGVIAPLEELWITWLMKEVALKPTYNAMLSGKA